MDTGYTVLTDNFGEKMVIEIVVEDKLILSTRDLQKISVTAYKTLQQIFTYKNPKFIENERYGYSNFNTAKHLYSYEILDGKMLISRGASEKIDAHLKKFGVKTKYIDRTLVLESVSFEHSKTVLRPEQEEFVSDMLAFNDGCGIAYTSFGKCHEKGTKILMFDGSLKNVENIRKSDLVMGVDSTSRTVLESCVGFGQMYEIEPNYGETFKVNDEHILSLQTTNHSLNTKLKSGEVVELTVKEYLDLPEWKKHILKLRRPEGIEFAEKRTEIPPYFMGVWLADGHKDNIVGFTVSDEDLEIYDYIKNYTTEHAYHLREVSDTRKCCELFLSKGIGQKNPLRIIFNKSIEHGAKFIPDEYKINSRINRLDLLAGILDGDGHLVKTDNKTFELAAKNKRFAKDVKFLAQSLGFKCSMVEKEFSYRKNNKRIYTGVGYRLHISGPTHLIPNKVKRKKASQHETRTNHLLTGFKIKPIGEGEYFGFTLTGDKLYMTDDFIVNHNTLSLLELIRRIAQPALVLVHTTFLQKQWIKEATDVNTFNMSRKEIGGVGGVFSDKKRRLGKLNVCLYQSLTKEDHLNFFKDFIGLVVFDEGQKSPIEGIQKVLNNFRARFRYTASAQLKRKDGKEFLTFDTFGPVRHVAKETNSDSKILSKIYLVPSSYDDEIYSEERQYTSMINRMGTDKDRNILICKRALKKVKQGKLVLIFVERKVQAAILAKYLRKYRVGLLLGAVNKADIADNPNVSKKMFDILDQYDDKNAYDKISAEAETKNIDIIIGTQKAEVGLSIRTIDHAIVTTPAGGNQERFKQMIGRVERTYSKKQEEYFGHKKDRPTVDVIVDAGLAPSKNAAYNIKDTYKGRVFKVNGRKA